MTHRIVRSISEPMREETDLTWEEIWQGPDKGLIHCWDLGRKRAMQEPELADKIKRNELPPLGWKGGVERRLKLKEKFGALFYLAEWQGLRGDDLDIDISKEVELLCSRTGMRVIFTPHTEKYAKDS